MHKGCPERTEYTTPAKPDAKKLKATVPKIHRNESMLSEVFEVRST